MPFMVIYSTSGGASCHEQTDAIDAAAQFAERVRNQDGIEEVRIYRMEEISFAFRPYYKVELGMPERQATDLAPVAPDPPRRMAAAEERALPAVAPAPDAAADAPAMMVSTPQPDGNGAHARRGLFGR